MTIDSVWNLIKSVSVPVLKRSTLWGLSDEVLINVAEGKTTIGRNSIDNGLPSNMELAKQILFYRMKSKVKKC